MAKESWLLEKAGSMRHANYTLEASRALPVLALLPVVRPAVQLLAKFSVRNYDNLICIIVTTEHQEHGVHMGGPLTISLKLNLSMQDLPWHHGSDACNSLKS